MAMNFQPNAMNGQYIQSPPFTPQFGSLGTSNTPPPWAAEVIQELKQLKQSLAKIDTIEKTVNKIHTKVNDLENKVGDIGKRLTEVEKTNAFLSEKYDDTNRSLKKTEENIKSLDEKCNTVHESMEGFEQQAKQLDDKINDLESRSMRENLLFYGHLENPGENCENIVANFIKDILSLDKEITLDRVHRIGAKRGSGTRPIVAKFHSYKDRELVRLTARDKQNELKPLNLGVGIQQTMAVLVKRRDLYPVMQREINAGRSVKWMGSKLLVKDGPGGSFREVSH